MSPEQRIRETIEELRGLIGATVHDDALEECIEELQAALDELEED